MAAGETKMSLELKEQMNELMERYDKETNDLKQHMGEVPTILKQGVALLFLVLYIVLT